MSILYLQMSIRLAPVVIFIEIRSGRSAMASAEVGSKDDPRVLRLRQIEAYLKGAPTPTSVRSDGLPHAYRVGLLAEVRPSLGRVTS